jgi:predicted PurR-regulated permease PerM
MNVRILAAGLMAVFLVATLFLHLVPPVFVGALIFVLIQTVAKRIAQYKHAPNANIAAVILLAVLALSALAGIGIGLSVVLTHGGGISALLLTLAKTLGGINQILPAWASAYIPESVDEAKDIFATWIREHGAAAGLFGKETLVALVQSIFAAIAAAMLAVHVAQPRERGALTMAIAARASIFIESFRRVAFAQIWISTVNSVLTAIFLFFILPLLGIEISFRWVLVAITFSAGLIPILGNLISNTAITLLAASVSAYAMIAALVFLVFLHKLEYFLNARIVGGQIEAKAWELLIAMIFMEAAFGLQGLLAAPVLYAYLKREASLAGLV